MNSCHKKGDKSFTGINHGLISKTLSLYESSLIINKGCRIPIKKEFILKEESHNTSLLRKQ